MKLTLAARPILAAWMLSLTEAAANNSDSPTLPLSTDSAFNFQFLITLGDAITGGADIGPVLGAAKNIVPGDFSSFSQQFYALANDTKAQAADPENAYDGVNVRETWFSASQYFRRADFFLHTDWDNPLITSLRAEQTAAFDAAIAALPIPGQRIRFSATKGNFTIDAIWYAASADPDAKLPTLVIGNGFDAAQEDSYHYFVASALARGWNCITYEGPGQPTIRREQHLGFIPDWENVVTPVVDYVLSEKANVVDENRLALVGNSFGGYLAARAVAFESRISAAVLVDGVWDLYAGYSSQLTPDIRAIYEAGNYSQFDQELLSLRAAGKLSSDAAWGVDYGLWAFNTHSPSDFFNQTKKFQLESVVDRINVPVFVGSAQFENIFIGQPQQVKDALGDKATLHLFNGTAGYHCQTAAGQEMTRAVFAWLNKTL
ncbi:20-hydroxy-prefusarin hydrolase [Lachnellula subtilissima]|uniref:20-hydroxy-prefusarin hydrolase n=1 Tax=Lachnellula subtilissima TaxID=602034 RepID=A0A8H8RMY2_9HELO|nr:20-hydroxy-prefusarin hydrolase [Lachnellula subtilissima]